MFDTEWRQAADIDWGEPDAALYNLISAIAPAAPTHVAVAHQPPLPAAASRTSWGIACHPQTTCSSAKAAQAAINTFAVGYGVVVVTSSSSRTILGCDRHLQRRTHNGVASSKPRDDVKSRRSGCEMRMTAKKLESGVCELVHGPTSSIHNHPAASTRFANPVQRRSSRTETVCEEIAVDAQIGVRPAKTLARLKTACPEAAITLRDVYNERQRAVTHALGGLSRIDFLLSVLRGGSYFVRFKVDKDRKLSHLFFADPGAIAIFRENPDVLMMDCTYKTNRYGMPLLNIVGVTGMNTTIHIAQVFLRRERELDFAWAHDQLHALRGANGIDPLVVFTDRDLALLNSVEIAYPGIPALLCLWHVIKAVETHARKHTFRKERTPSSASNVPSCSCARVQASIRTTGLPCAHRLHRASTHEQPLVPHDFHAHWWVRRNQANPPSRPEVLEPGTIQARRAAASEARWLTHARGGGVSGVRRMPSRFELSPATNSVDR